MKKLELNCTKMVHDRIGINAVVNARGGISHLNQPSQEDCDLYRDGNSIKGRLTQRIRFYQLNSKFFRRKRNLARVAHLMSSYTEDLS